MKANVACGLLSLVLCDASTCPTLSRVVCVSDLTMMVLALPVPLPHPVPWQDETAALPALNVSRVAIKARACTDRTSPGTHIVRWWRKEASS